MEQVKSLLLRFLELLETIFLPHSAEDWIFYIPIYYLFIKALWMTVKSKSSFDNELISFEKATKNLISKYPDSNELQDTEDIIKKECPSLFYNWDEFKESLVPIGTSKEKEEENENVNLTFTNQYANTEKAEKYFDIEAIQNKFFHFDLYELYPNILIGIGILGTFTGLIIALKELNPTDLLSADFEKGKFQLEALFDGIKVSFKSSVLGIFGSVILNFWLKYLEWYSHGKVEDKIVEVIDNKFELETAVKKLIDIDKNLKSVKEEVFREITRISQNLTDTLAESYSNDTSRVVDAIVNLAKPMENVTSNAQQSLGEGMNVIMDEMLKKVQDSTTGQLEKVTDGLQLLTTSVSSVMESVEQSSRDMAEKSRAYEQSFNKLNEVSSNMEKMFSYGNQSREQMAELQSNISEISKDLKSNMSNVSSITNEINSNLDHSVTNFSEITKRITEILPQVNEMSSGLRETMNVSNQVVTSANTGYQNFINNADRVDRAFKESISGVENINNASSRLQDSIMPIERGINGLNELISTFNDSTNRFTTVNNSVERLTTTVEGLEKQFSDVSEKQSSLSEANSQAINSHNEYKTKLDEINSSLKEVLENYNKVLVEVGTEYESILENGVKKLNENIGTFSTVVSQAEFDLLSESLQETSEELKKTCEALNNRS